jgi:hypothetical protein
MKHSNLYWMICWSCRKKYGKYGARYAMRAIAKKRGIK